MSLTYNVICVMNFEINFDPFALGRQWVIWLKKNSILFYSIKENIINLDD